MKFKKSYTFDGSGFARYARSWLGSIAVSAMVLNTSAFGPDGHRIVARIAENHIAPETAIAVQNILDTETLVEVSTWADWIRSDPSWKHSGPWHYINMPDGVSYEDSEKNPDGDAFTKLAEFIETLRSTDASKEERAESLKWIVHLVGDLHQPLHVGRSEDWGGNKIEGSWFGESTNAHRVWDSNLIESSEYSFSEYAESIDRRFQVEIEAGAKPDIRRWIAESASYRDQAYKMPEPSTSGTYRYIFENLELVEQRLKQAGLRLAKTLDYALGTTEVWTGMPKDLHWMRNSAEYQALTSQVYATARTRLESMLESGEFKGIDWAVVLDADETVLDNSLFAKESAGKPFDIDAWDDWCRRAEAPGVPGAVAFVKYVKQKGGHVAIVSNRSVRVQKETEVNLKSIGVDFDVVLLKENVSDKSPRWKLLNAGEAKEGLPPLQLKLFFGDNILDFPDLKQDRDLLAENSVSELFGTKFFVLPNPNYGSFESSSRL